jgi:hypothetical protein
LTRHRAQEAGAHAPPGRVAAEDPAPERVSAARSAVPRARSSG